MSDLAPFANVWPDSDELLDGGLYEMPTPEDRDDMAQHDAQNALFDAGWYEEDEQQLFVRMR